VFLVKNMFIRCRFLNWASSAFGNEALECLRWRVAEQLVQPFARRRTNRLSFAQDLARAHHGTRTVLATHEAGHGRAAK